MSRTASPFTTFGTEDDPNDEKTLPDMVREGFF
jgi:hypothetical protein